MSAPSFPTSPSSDALLRDLNRGIVDADLRALLSRVESLRHACAAMEQEHAATFDLLDDDRRRSARNLVHYLALRSNDLRELQHALARLGLSSLGRNESHVLANLSAVASALASLDGMEHTRFETSEVSAVRGRSLLSARAEALLGPAPEGRSVRIMVTLPSEAANDESLVESLLAAGMTVARINTAHDAPEDWERMATLVRAVADRLGTHCRVLIDLAGPKLRTGAIEPGPEVLRLRPRRDALGRVTSPARAILLPGGVARPAGETTPAIPVPADFLKDASVGDIVEFYDARERRRHLTIAERRADASCLATCDRTVYLTTGARLELMHRKQSIARGRAGRLPALPQSILVRPGDRLLLSRHPGVGRPAGRSSPAVITTTLPEAFEHARPGETVWFDDGKVGAVIRAVGPDSIELEVASSLSEGSRIAADKGVNLPDTDVRVAGLTADDIAILPVVARCADMVGMSFVQSSADIADLRSRLAELGGERLGTVLKIETRRAFENLPSLLLAALQGPCAGVMIARGDLAVECGFERLAEVQEEILWLCEAAHVPVIWATQVLESLAKTGRVSRAEVTDAAMSERAECVMLNKGPYIADAVRFLDGVLRRMSAHQDKKRPMLRALNVARRFVEPEGK
ncbi:MAG: hypothetical protein IT434_13820 [Phycisphaerales bacterium]|jgi:pyruvate kinase|nr:hypothetical protein [Phycisphaerales bacterium]